MRLSLILLFISCFTVYGKGLSQKITLSFSDAPLEKIFPAIERQAGVSFVYGKEQLAGKKINSLVVKNETLEAVLQLLFKGQGLSYSITGIYISVKVSNETPPSDPNVIDIKGKIQNENGEPVIATITIKGTTNSTSSNASGEFELKGIDGNAVLVISGVSIEQREIAVQSRSNLLISVRMLIKPMEETIIKGYYSSSKKLSTGSVSKITAAEIAAQPVGNPLLALQGRASGVFIQTENGAPGGNVKVLIRGRGSITAGTDPLYVIDGVPYDATPLNSQFSALNIGVTGLNSPFNNLNPSDIESVEILKDADASAIYGSRGANGVILITTKKGKPGKLKTDVHFYQGLGTASVVPEFMNLREHLMIRREGFANSGIVPSVNNAPDLLVWDTTKATDWPEYILGGTSHITNGQIGLSGGNENTTFLVSGNYRREGSILPFSLHYQRAGLHFSLNHQTNNKRFSLNFAGSYAEDKNKTLPGGLLYAINLPPNIPVYDATGNINFNGFDNSNPAAMGLQKDNQQTDFLNANLLFRYRVAEGLFMKLSLGMNRSEMHQLRVLPQRSLDPAFGEIGHSQWASNRQRSLIAEPQLEYSLTWGKSVIQALAGATYQKRTRQNSVLTGSNFSSEDLMESVGSATTLSGSNFESQYKYASVFGRVNYTLSEKYILNTVIRRDGSSRFGPGRQYGNFGSAGIAWLFYKEKFLSRFSWLSYGKIKGSYGITGNDQIGDYQYLSTYGTGSPYNGSNALRPRRFSNELFGWERNKKLEVAAELGFLSDRILMNAAWFRNISDNQLIEYSLPYLSGPFGYYIANMPARVLNSGWEFDLSAEVFQRKDLRISLKGNLTLPTNKLLDYPGLASSSYAYTYTIGMDLSTRRMFDFTGIDPATGLPQYTDVDGDGIISAPNDWVNVGRTSPFYYGGAGVQFSYKSWSLVTFFQYAKQFNMGTVNIPGTSSGKFKSALNRWQKPGDITQVPRAVSSLTAPYRNLSQSDAAFWNASYVRFKNLEIAWHMPEQLLNRLKITKLKIFMEGQNLFTWWKKGNLYDPETANMGISPLRIITAGIAITF